MVNGILVRLQPTHEPVLCREKFIIKKIKRVYTNKYCGYLFPCGEIFLKILMKNVWKADEYSINLILLFLKYTISNTSFKTL